MKRKRVFPSDKEYFRSKKTKSLSEEKKVLKPPTNRERIKWWLFVGATA